MGYRPPGSSVHGNLQARILESFAMPSSSYAQYYVYINPKLLIYLPPHFPFGNHKFVFSAYESLSVLKVSSFASSFETPHISDIIRYLSSSDLPHLVESLDPWMLLQMASEPFFWSHLLIYCLVTFFANFSMNDVEVQKVCASEKNLSKRKKFYSLMEYSAWIFIHWYVPEA